MKYLFNFQKNLIPLVLATLLSSYTANLNATNPTVSNNLVNLSQGLLSAEYEDFNTEMVIEGNTIHAVWTNRAGNYGGYLFYARSTDLGKTWETPRQIWQYKDGSYAAQVVSQKLAVTNNDVYICFSHHDYYGRATDGIYLVKSSDNGQSFECWKGICVRLQ